MGCISLGGDCFLWFYAFVIVRLGYMFLEVTNVLAMKDVSECHSLADVGFLYSYIGFSVP
jgi:hypothetical protein